MEYSEQRIYLIQISSRLTAKGAHTLFKFKIPTAEFDIDSEKGKLEIVIKERQIFLLLFCTNLMRDVIESKIGLVVKSQDVTDRIVTDFDYDFKNSPIAHFNYELFEILYRQEYLKNAPIEFVLKRIKKMGTDSRYIDHHMIYNFRKK